MGLKHEILPITKEEWKIRNIRAYKGKHPPLELVKKVMGKTGMGHRKFEIAFGMPDCTVKKFLYGMRVIPELYWHIFYEFNDLHWIAKKAKRQEKQTIAPEVKKKEVNLTNKSLIDEFRQRLNG